jgi:DNA-binding winged helix-turn-helix (wHTH) protein/Tol biopolymer transport system component
MEGVSPRFYEFGEFRLDTRQRILLRDDETIVLSARMFDLLFLLVQYEGQILDHDELLERIWEGTFVEQANLKKSISMLRQILGEKPNQSRYIKTIPRRGYSFVAEVTPISSEETVTVREIEKEIFVEDIIETSDPPQTLLLSPNRETFFSRNKWQLTGSVVAVLAVCTFLVAAKFFFNEQPINFSIENVRARRLTTEGTLGNATMVSADGSYILYPLYDGETGSLWIRQIATGSVRQIIEPSVSQFWAYNFSPDGSHIFYIVNYQNEPEKSGLYKISFLGGTPKKLESSANGGLAFSPDGNRLAYKRASDDRRFTEIVSIDQEGKNIKKIFTVPENKFLMSINWSPDGQSLLCAMRETVSEKNLNYVAEISIDGSSETVVFPHQENPITSAAWLPDMSSLMLSIREKNADICQIWQYFPSKGTKKRVTNDNASYRVVSLTKDGKVLTTTQETGLNGVWTADTTAFDFTPVTSQTISVSDVVWTPDGRLVYVTTENTEEMLAIMNADGSESRKITDGRDGIYLNPRISKDGKWVVFSSSRNGGTDQIWKVSFDGKELIQLVNNPEMHMADAELMADGETVIYRGFSNSTGWNLYQQGPDGSTVKLTESDSTDWDISNDGRSIFYFLLDEKTKKYLTHVRNLETGETTRTLDIQAWQIEWSHDGKGLVYLKYSKDNSEMIFQPLDGSPPKPLFSLRGEKIRRFNFSQDGAKLAANRGKAVLDAVLIRSE